jgi:hypothetical protein
MNYSHGYGFSLDPGQTHPVCPARAFPAIVLSLAAGSAAGRHRSGHHYPQHQEWGHLHHQLLTLEIAIQIHLSLPHLGYKEDPAHQLYCIFCAWTWAPQMSAYSYVQTLTMPIDRVLSLRQLRQDELLQLPKMEVIRVDNSCPLTVVS